MGLLDYESQKLSEELVYLKLRGSFCYPYVFTVKDEFYQILNENQKNLLVDLNNLEYIDSVGVGIIIGLQLRVKQLNGTIYLICKKVNILKILELVSLDKAFRIFSSLEEAKNELM